MRRGRICTLCSALGEAKQKVGHNLLRLADRTLDVEVPGMLDTPETAVN